MACLCAGGGLSKCKTPDQISKLGRTWQSDPKHIERPARLEILLTRCPSDMTKLGFALPFLFTAIWDDGQ